MADIRIEYLDGRVGSVEVVLDMDPAWAATYAEVRKRQFKIATPDLGRFWFVWLNSNCNLRRLEHSLESILARLEAESWPLNARMEVVGLKGVSAEADRLAGHLAKLGVDATFCREDPQPGIQLVPSGTGGLPQSWRSFQVELSRVFRSDGLADVREKLAFSGGTERHVFLGASFSSSWSMNYWLGRDRVGLPAEPPDLPAEFTHMWVWSYPFGRALGWFPDRGWFDPSTNWATP